MKHLLLVFTTLSIVLAALFSGGCADKPASQPPSESAPVEAPSPTSATPPPVPEATPSVPENPVVSTLATPSLEGAPPMPAGFDSRDAAIAAVMSGKVELVDIAAPLPDGIVEEKDVEYGNPGGSRPLLLDLYQPATTPQSAPGILFIHGGGWYKGNRQDLRVYAVRYASRGCVAATISYRLSEEATFPAAIEDVKCAIRWMRANAGSLSVDPNQIHLVGGSAGAHLALLAAYSPDVPEFEGNGGHPGVSSAVASVVNFFGPVDLTAPEARDSAEVRRFLGSSYSDNPTLYAKASPITYLAPGDPPTLTFHGSIDELVPIAQAEQLAAKLKELGIFYLYDRYEGWPHTMNVAKPISDRCLFYMDHFFSQISPKKPDQ